MYQSDKNINNTVNKNINNTVNRLFKAKIGNVRKNKLTYQQENQLINYQTYLYQNKHTEMIQEKAKERMINRELTNGILLAWAQQEMIHTESEKKELKKLTLQSPKKSEKFNHRQKNINRKEKEKKKT